MIGASDFERLMENLPWTPQNAAEQEAWLRKHGVDPDALKAWVMGQVEEDWNLHQMLPVDPFLMATVSTAYHMGFLMGFRVRAET